MGGELSGRRTGFPAVLQTDMVVEPKDCGGPVVDLDGKVLGINIARAGRVETWILPSENIRPLLDDLKAGKSTAARRGLDAAGRQSPEWGEGSGSFPHPALPLRFCSFPPLGLKLVSAPISIRSAQALARMRDTCRRSTSDSS